jgi:hypothetical protein
MDGRWMVFLHGIMVYGCVLSGWYMDGMVYGWFFCMVYGEVAKTMTVIRSHLGGSGIV